MCFHPAVVVIHALGSKGIGVVGSGLGRFEVISLYFEDKVRKWQLVMAVSFWLIVNSVCIPFHFSLFIKHSVFCIAD